MNMNRYRCMSCSYSFIPKSSREPKSCPYCSKTNLTVEETAEDILNSVD